MPIAKFLEYLELEKNYSPHTVLNYKRDLKQFQQYYQQETSDTDISKASKIHIRSYLMELSGKSYSERSINRKISAIKSFYKYLLKVEAVSVSPAAGIKTLRQYNEVQVPFSEDELLLLFESDGIFPSDFTGMRDRLVLDLFYQTGIRRNELIQLKIRDINFEEKHIKVLGKRNKERIIPVNDQLLFQLATYIESRAQVFPVAGDWLFLTSKGKPFYDKLVYNLVNSYLSLVSTKHKKSPHTLRHSFATHLLNHGAELNAVKELLGHTSLAATQVYTHSSIEQLKKVFNQAHPREQTKTKNYDN